MLGKRKRDVAVARRQNESSLEQGQTISPDGSDNDQDVFRRYFESTFEPLPESEKVKPSSHDSDEEENEVSDEIESDWEGLSEDGANVTAIQVVEHKTAPTTSDRREDERQQYKSFMVSRTFAYDIIAALIECC